MIEVDKAERLKLYSYSELRNEIEVTYFVNNSDKSGGYKSLCISITDLKELICKLPKELLLLSEELLEMEVGNE